MNKLIITALTATALLLGTGAATASAADWEPNEFIHVTTPNGSTMKITDHESFGANEVGSFSLGGTVLGTLNGWSKPSFKHELSRCVGGEVRVELHTEAHTYSDVRVGFMTAWLELYEGTSCNTTDLDGMTPKVNFTLNPGQMKTFTFNVNNQAEGGDYATATIKFAGNHLFDL